MKKLFLIGWKDLTLAFRDKAALILMLAAPFALTLGMGAVTGGFSGDSSGLSDIPVVIVNQDGGELGDTLVEVFQSADLSDLIEPTVMDDPVAARKMVDDNQSAAAIIIPAGFTQSVISEADQAASGETIQVELYTNPIAPTSASVIRTILDEYINRMEVGRVGARVTVFGLISSGRIQAQDAAVVGQAVGAGQAEEPQPSITIKTVIPSGETVEFNILAFMAPGMALMFLMFTTSNGGRSLLTERNQGTLPRLLVSPTTGVQVLGGKVIGIFLTGVAQMLILILGTTILFRLEWGDPLGVLVLVLAAVFGATGWGMLITALVKTPGQVSAIGSAIMLTFGILGGTFVNTEAVSSWFSTIAKISPNAWGVDGFATLALGGRLVDIMTPVFALLIMGALLFSIAVLLFNRRGIMKK
jgi:ABC-2 type transport system permease protein